MSYLKRVDFGLGGSTTIEGNTTINGNLNVSQPENLSRLTQTFSPILNYPSSTTGYTVSGQNIACSSTGQYVSLCANERLYVSSDYGFTMTQITVSNNMHAITMSSTGQYQACISTGVPSCGIYVSNNYGVTWTIYSLGYNLGRWLQAITMSPSGQYIFGAGGGSAGLRNYVSIDFGVTWSQYGSILQRVSCFINYSTLEVTTLTSSNVTSSNILYTLNSSGLETENVRQPSLTNIRRIVSDGGLRSAYMSSTSNTYNYSIDGALTFVSGTLPFYLSTNFGMFFCMTATKLWVLRGDQRIYSTSDFVTWTMSTLNTLEQFLSSDFRSFTVSYDNSVLYVLHMDGTLYSQKLYSTTAITPKSLIFLDGLTNNVQSQIKNVSLTAYNDKVLLTQSLLTVQVQTTNTQAQVTALLNTTQNMSVSNNDTTLIVNKVYETIRSTTGTTIFTADMSLGSTFYIPTNYTFSSNFQLIIQNVPIDTSRVYTISLIYRQTNTSFYISTARVSDTASTYLLGTASTFSAPYFSNGTPTLGNVPNLIIQSFSIISTANTSNTFTRTIVSSVNNNY